eukprot:CAMPEP_0185729686 /NCGR_PEP_ID=MMETSP1171-20130828/6976_1 /TAXON_ID=374046 /ORGANISM="Helicotheca tamensis, Strain CCMP826" /LENGTH=400 /DNA_ID=CAMNT_0028398583 /DNA_START=19 /DNA_END=1221 /DNA_ORIENTATION=+
MSSEAEHQGWAMVNKKRGESKFQKKIDEDARAIQDHIIKVGNDFRRHHPWMEKYQDLIGLSILTTGITVTLTCAYLIWTDSYNSIKVPNFLVVIFPKLARATFAIPYWVLFLISMFATSIVHEIEHDTIHNMYFPRNKAVNNLMLLAGWLVRWNIINPWLRRRLHFWHHKASGTESDLEERGITNGHPFGLKRLLMCADGILSTLLRPIEIAKTARAYHRAQTKKDAFVIPPLFPFGMMHYAMVYSFLAYHTCSLTNDLAVAGGGDGCIERLPNFIIDWMPIMSKYFWAIGFPNAVRQFMLFFISSSVHYFGDINIGDVHHQTQVWLTWLTLPFDLFTFNFSGTHAIHHYVARDPFYIRQLTAHEVYPVMKQHGTRFNDFHSILRSNRFLQDYVEKSWHW